MGEHDRLGEAKEAGGVEGAVEESVETSATELLFVRLSASRSLLNCCSKSGFAPRLEPMWDASSKVPEDDDERRQGTPLEGISE